MAMDRNCLQVLKIEKKPSFEPDLQQTIPTDVFWQSSADDECRKEDEKFLDVLDDVLMLKQTLWNFTRDMEEISEKVTKLRCELAKLQQMRTAGMTCVYV